MPLERDAMAAVVAAETDVEAVERDPLGFLGVALRLLDLGDEARIHRLGSSTTPLVPARAGHGDSRSDVFWARGLREFPRFAPDRRGRERARPLPRVLRQVHRPR